MMPDGAMSTERYLWEREQEKERYKPRPHRVILLGRRNHLACMVRYDNKFFPGWSNGLFFIHPEVADMFAGLFNTPHRTQNSP